MWLGGSQSRRVKNEYRQLCGKCNWENWIKRTVAMEFDAAALTCRTAALPVAQADHNWVRTAH